MKWKDRRPRLSDEVERLRSLAPHEVLKIPESASINDIKNAYRRLVKIYHPDRTTAFMRDHNEQVIKIINEAYEHLIRLKCGENK